MKFTVIDPNTGKYPDCREIVLREDWTRNLVYCDVEQFLISEDGNLFLMDDCDNIVRCPPGRFKVKFIKEKLMRNHEKCCGTCKYHQNCAKSEWVCVNPDSGNYTDYTDYHDTCGAWEGRTNERRRV